MSGLVSRWRARALARCHNIDDLRRLARRRLPQPVFDYADGGAEDEVTLRRNVEAFAHYRLRPRVLVDVADVALSTTVMGQPVSMPILCAPTGLTRLFHHEGELAVARAAAAAGTVYTLSSVASRSIEDVAAASAGPRWFQIYVWRDRGLLADFIDRCREQGYGALCLTVDVPALGRRERDLRNGMTIPPRLRLRGLADTLLRPYWLYHYLTTEPFVLANVAGHAGTDANDMGTLAEYTNRQFDPSVTWDDLAWMIERWGGPFAIKGVLRADDARRAVEAGVSAVVVSNHGGRQLDHAPAALEALPEVVAAVDGRGEVLLDGGVRRGSDVLKALALGARAVLIGRAYLYGLAAGGEAGVARALELLRTELLRAMQLAGVRSVAEVGPDLVADTAAASPV